MGGEGEEKRDGGVEEEVVVVILSGHAGQGAGGGSLKAVLLFLPSILDPRQLKGVKMKGGVWFEAAQQ